MSSSVFSRASTTRWTPSCSSTAAPDASCTVICVEPWISSAGYTRRMSRTSPRSCTITASMPRSMHSPRSVERIRQLGRLDQRVEREVDARAARVREAARLVELLERELRAIVARIEPLGAQIDGVGAIGDRGPRGIERAGG